jgi:hypothetical protein
MTPPTVFITTYSTAVGAREWFLKEAVTASTKNALHPCNVEVISGLDSNPRKRNKAVDRAEDVFVLLHDDCKPLKGFLRNFVVELEWCESFFGKPVIICPTQLPYLVPKSVQEHYPQLKHSANLFTCQEEYKKFCNKYGVPLQDNEPVCHFPYCGLVQRSATPITDDGHQLMLFCTRKTTMEMVGPCEDWDGKDFDDVDWGLRALMKGVKVLQSHTTYVMHLQGLTFSTLNRPSNAERFIKKWGREFFDRVQDGSKWIELHDSQMEGA